MMKPTILIVSTLPWYPAARLAKALVSAGFRVEAACHPHHALGKTASVANTYNYHGLAPLRSIEIAIEASNPDLVIPADDQATRHLHCIHARAQDSGERTKTLRALIERSLGSPESFPIVHSRAAFVGLARDLGIRAPETRAITTLLELREWTAQRGFPTVLKSDGTSGGDGVRIVRSLGEAERATRFLKAPPSLVRAAKRAILDNDETLLWPSLVRSRPAVSAQDFVDGREATSTVVCWRGSVLASLHFEVVHKRDSAGPATVMRLIEHQDMAFAVEKIVRRLNLSGINGFDFMVEATTGGAHLIEINPRLTQVGHLALGPKRDIAAALFAAVSGEPLRSAQKVTENDTIALFPQEWLRNPESAFFRSAYHDVPWDEPELLRACLRKRKLSKALKYETTLNRSFSAIGAPPL